MNLPKILSNWNSIHLLKTIFLAKCFSFSLKPDTKQIFLLLLISNKFSSHSFFSFPLCVSFLVSNYQNDFNCSDCSSSSNNDLQMFYWNDIKWGWKKSLKNKTRRRKKCQKFCKDGEFFFLQLRICQKNCEKYCRNYKDWCPVRGNYYSRNTNQVLVGRKVCTHTHTHIHTRTWTHMCTHACTHTHTHIHEHTCAHTYFLSFSLDHTHSNLYVWEFSWMDFQFWRNKFRSPGWVDEWLRASMKLIMELLTYAILQKQKRYVQAKWATKKVLKWWRHEGCVIVRRDPEKCGTYLGSALGVVKKVLNDFSTVLRNSDYWCVIPSKLHIMLEITFSGLGCHKDLVKLTGKVHSHYSCSKVLKGKSTWSEIYQILFPNDYYQWLTKLII